MAPRSQESPASPPLSLLQPLRSKASFQSPTPSSEADDEGSNSDLRDGDMEPDQAVDSHGRRARYLGEDTRLTSKKELSGWYSYGWAAEVFVVCGVGSFIPITLEQLAREQGVLLNDQSRSCTSKHHQSKLSDLGNGPSTAPSFLATRAPQPRPDIGQCVVHILGVEVNTASFAMYTFSLSVLIQALLIISMSGAADHGRYRKKLLLSFAFTGAVAMMLFLPVVPKVYILGALFAIIANTCFGASFVLLNSFLPLLVRHHPSIQRPFPDSVTGATDFSFTSENGVEENEHEGSIDEAAEGEMLDSTAHLLGPASRAESNKPTVGFSKASSPELQLSTQISSYGIGIGYIAAVLVQVLAIVLVYLTGSTTFSLRLVLFVIGLWWLTFTLPAALWLRPRPGPPIPFTSSGKQRRGWVAYTLYAWRSLGKTAMRARHLKDMVLFLCAWFLVSDGIATVSGTAVLFAKTELQMSPTALAMISVIGTLTGVFGAFTWARLSRFFKLRPSQTILTCICLFEIIPLYGLLGYIPQIRDLGVFGLQQPWEMYPLGAIYGFVLGGLSSYCRSLFGELIPPGSEAAFYALYAITDKGSSVFGPAIVGAITDRYGEIRPAFAFLAVLIFVPLPLMACVDTERGRKEAAELAEELEGKKKARSVGAEDERITMIDAEGRDDENGTISSE